MPAGISLGSITAYVTLDTSKLTSGVGSANQALQKLGEQGSKTGNIFDGMLPTFLKYRVLSEIFGETTKAIGEVTTAVLDLERQTSRVQRILPELGRGLIGRDIVEESARLGVSIKDAGEAFYQMGTFIKDPVKLLGAVKNAMNLVVGTEGDVREVTRAVVQTFFQFNNELMRGTDETGALNRAGELLAITYRDAHAEIGEVTNALKYFGPAAAAAKVSAEQVFAVIGAEATVGIRGRAGGTGPAQFLLQIIKNYKEGLEGIGGIKRGDKEALFPLFRNEQGGPDLIKTLEGIVQIGKRMPQAELEKFLTTLTGTVQSFRFLGTITQDLDRMKEGVHQNRMAMQDLTHVAEGFKKIMTTDLPGEMSKAWQGALTAMATAFQQFAHDIHLPGLFRDIQGVFTAGPMNRETSTNLSGAGMFDESAAIASRIALLKRIRGKAGIDEKIYISPLQYFGREHTPGDVPMSVASEALKGINIDSLAGVGMSVRGGQITEKITELMIKRNALIRADAEKRFLASQAKQSVNEIFNPLMGTLFPVSPDKPLGTVKGGFRTGDDEKGRREREKELEDARREAEAIRSSRAQFGMDIASQLGERPGEEGIRQKFLAERLRFNEALRKSLSEQPKLWREATELNKLQIEDSKRRESDAIRDFGLERNRALEGLRETRKDLAGIMGVIPIFKPEVLQEFKALSDLEEQGFKAKIHEFSKGLSDAFLDGGQLLGDAIQKFQNDLLYPEIFSAGTQQGSVLDVFRKQSQVLADAQDREAEFKHNSALSGIAHTAAGMGGPEKDVREFQRQSNQRENQDYMAYLQSRLAAYEQYTEGWYKYSQMIIDLQRQMDQETKREDRDWKKTFKFLPDLFEEIGHEAGSTFTKGLQKALGNTFFGRALARTLQREVDDLMDNLTQQIFRKAKGAGKATGLSGSGGGGLVGTLENMALGTAFNAATGGLFDLLGGIFGGSGGGGGGIGGILGGITGALGFDNPVNDRMANRFGFDFGRHFSNGAKDGISPVGRATHSTVVHAPVTIHATVSSDVDIPRLASEVAWQVRTRLPMVTARA